jgi:hypothetical protein
MASTARFSNYQTFLFSDPGSQLTSNSPSSNNSISIPKKLQINFHGFVGSRTLLFGSFMSFPVDVKTDNSRNVVFFSED